MSRKECRDIYGLINSSKVACSRFFPSGRKRSEVHATAILRLPTPRKPPNSITAALTCPVRSAMTSTTRPMFSSWALRTALPRIRCTARLSKTVNGRHWSSSRCCRWGTPVQVMRALSGSAVAGRRSYLASAGGRCRVGTTCPVFIDWLARRIGDQQENPVAPSESVARDTQAGCVTTGVKA
jgi:hypothetical protein